MLRSGSSSSAITSRGSASRSTVGSSSELIHHRIAARARSHPDARAVVCDGVVVSYGELDARANRVAHHLVERGVGPDVIVGVQMERSIDLVVAMLAVMKAGGAYLPLDPSYPAERNAFMLADASARLVITERDMEIAGPSTAIERDVDPANLAYIIYTSGSTGRPKGVMISHDRVMRLMSSTQEWFRFDEKDVWTFFHSYAFDFSVWEIWGALIYGGCVVVVPDAVRRSPDELLALLAREKVSVLNQVPSAFRHLIASATRGPTVPLSLRYVIFGGEALELRGLVPWFDRYPTQPKLVNMYGITETTVHVTYREIEPAECLSPRGSPIGVPIPDLEMYVLDASLHEVEIGGEGEIFVGGKGIARGYHARPGLTAERFVPDPFSGRAGDRLYKTGDTARRLADGFEYLGRNDAQVKIRGHRIETGEIASILATHPAVREAAVVVKSVEGDKRLVAYLAVKELVLEEIRAHAKEKLPSYMIPSAFVIVDALPITPSGKIDANALPEPDWSTHSERGEYVAPATEDERMIAELWSALIGVSPIGRFDRFFELGGHSLLAAQVASRLAAETGVSVPVRLFLQSPTVEEAATGFAEARGRQAGHVRATVALPKRANADQAPLSSAQEAIWGHEQVMREVQKRPRGYVECAALHLRGPLKPALLERALNEIASRHEIWRTGFTLVDDEPVQTIGRSARIAIRAIDRKTTPADAQRSELEASAEQLTAQPFVVDRPPLVRCALVAFGPDHHVLLLSMHHLITDAWSEDLIAAELARLYAFLAAGDPLPPRTEIAAQYGDWAAFEGSDDNARARDEAQEYWRRTLAGAPEPLTLPTATGGTRPIRISRRIDGQRLAAYGRQHNLSVSTAIYAAFARVMSRYATGERFVLGIATANRAATTERLPGVLSGVMPVVVDVSGTFVATAERLRARIAEASAFGGVALPALARMAGRRRGAPLVQVQASTQILPRPHRAGTVTVEQDFVPVNDAKFALEIVVTERDDRSVEISWVADPHVFDVESLQSIASELERDLAEALT
ncbi:MAG TPA: amino acid adenylation domain-containing protein [Kofleriaceae bacterium]